MDAEFRSCLSEVIGEERAAFALEALDAPASVSLRLNPFKTAALAAKPENGASEDTGGTVDFACRTVEEALMPVLDGSLAVPWSPYAYVLKDRPSFTLDPLFHAGAYYVQDSSAMFVGHVFRAALGGGSATADTGAAISGTASVDRSDTGLLSLGRPLRVLDLCAAPGGKTTDLAASLRQAVGGNFLLVANETIFSRASVLSGNVGLWGDPNVLVTSADPSVFGRKEGCFDVIVADVPCSGEGMFRKDMEARKQWSPDAVNLCASRQRRIVAAAWPSLADGGILIYSTCTFNKPENDGNVLWIAEELGAEVLKIRAGFPGIIETGCGSLLVPGFVPGEGQYCAVLKKRGGAAPARPGREVRGEKPALPFFRELFACPVRFIKRRDTYLALPDDICREVTLFEDIRTLRAGTAVGVVKGCDLVPHEDLALSIALKQTSFVRADVSLPQALDFLRKAALVLPEVPRGLVMLCYAGMPLGFVRNLGSRCNNLLPSYRKIRI